MEVSTEEAEIKVLKSCKCGEFEKRIVELELEIEKRKIEYQELEAKFEELGEEKNGLENEVKGLRAKIGEVKEVDGVVDLTVGEEEDKVMQLMIENKVLECEKKSAEREVEIWREKYKELELYVSKLDDSVELKGGRRELDQAIRGKDGADPTCNTPGTPFSDIMCNHTVGGKLGFCLDSEGKCGRQVRKNLSFEEGESPSKKMAPSTPGHVRPAGPNVINIGDSDDETDISGRQMVTPEDRRNGKVCNVMDHSLEGTPDSKSQKISEISLKGAVCNQICKEDMDACNDNVPCVSTPKRKRAANVVASDTESDEDDNVPISKLKRMHLRESIPHKASIDSVNPMSDDVKGPVTRSRRRLATLRQHEGKVKAGSSSNNTSENNYKQGIPTTDVVEDSESDDAGSDSEGESLDGFIVNDTYVSDADDTSSQSEEKSDGGNGASKNEDNDGSSLSGDGSDGDMNFGKILSRFKRSKNHKFKWEFEGDMLADFGKDPELCMKAVCALYRQQTAEEKLSKETLHYNGRGFSKFDAQRGSELAEFLIDGDPSGNLKKSVQELQEHNSKGVELCRKLATHYSKQLFEIYKNKEDPLFLPRDQVSQ